MASEDFENAVRGWIARKDEVAQLERSLVKVRAALVDAEARLARLIIPSDIKQQEKIAVWVRTGRKTECLVAVTWEGGANYTVTRRGHDREVDKNGNPEPQR